MQELDTEVLDTEVLDTEALDTEVLDTSDEETSPGRHRAPASAARRVVLRLVLAALGVLLASGLGAVAADLGGLSDLGLPSQDAPRRLVPQDREDEPRPQLATHAGEELPAPESAAPSPELRAVDAVTAADAPAPPPSAQPPSPAPLPTVRTGDSCPAVGQTGVTARGDAAVCTASPGHGPNKWRAA